MDFSDRTVVGLTERVELKFAEGFKKTLVAKIDSGADKCSVDEGLVRRLGIGPIIGYKVIKQTSGIEKRPYVKLKVRIQNRTIIARFTIADRGQMRYKLLIGNNILKRRFLIDPMRK